MLTTLPDRLRKFASDERALYVAVNLFVNLLFLLRGYVFLLVLGYRELGLVALLQSIVLLLGILQFGVLNGGYRLLLSAEEEAKARIIDFTYTFIALLSALSITMAAVFWLVLDDAESGLIGLLGAIGGAAALLRNWQTNQIIAAGRLTVLNIVNFTTALLSFVPFLFLETAAFEACVATIVLQPVLFALAAWIFGAVRRPARFGLSRELLGQILTAGFIVFFAGILLQVNIQLERWYVTVALGVEALGHLFVAIMFVTVLQLVPNALNAIFLPPAVAAHKNEDAASLASVMRTYLWLLLAYAFAAALAVWLLAEPVLALLAPAYLQDLVYVYLIAPGALMITISAAFALGFVVLIEYRYMLIAYSAGTLVLFGILASALASGSPLSLESVVTARSAALGLTSLGVVGGWWALSKQHSGLRFLSRSRGDAT